MVMTMSFARHNLLKLLQHAFAVDTALPAPAPAQTRLVDRLAREVVRRHLTTPALAFLEMSRPLNFLGAQAMHFFTPMAAALFDGDSYQTFAQFLERRDAIDLIAARIEQLEAVAAQQDSQQL